MLSLVNDLDPTYLTKVDFLFEEVGAGGGVVWVRVCAYLNLYSLLAYNFKEV